MANPAQEIVYPIVRKFHNENLPGETIVAGFDCPMSDRTNSAGYRANFPRRFVRSFNEGSSNFFSLRQKMRTFWKLNEPALSFSVLRPLFIFNNQRLIADNEIFTLYSLRIFRCIKCNEVS